MGGSAVAGELLSAARNDVVVHWDYGIPRGLTSDDLVVCTSWSGTTAEALSSLEAAVAAGLTVAAITTGGALADRARELHIPLVLLPADGHPPRVNAGLMTGALFGLLGMADALPTIDAAALEEQGKTLALAIGDKSPVFYAAYPWRRIAGFFKTVINEDAKRPAWSGSFPSVAHNEIMGWSWDRAPKSLVPVLIRTPQDEARYGNDMQTLVAILSEKGYTVPTIALPDGSAPGQALIGYCIALWTGFHVATAAGVDPSGTAWIDEFKTRKARL
jgi:glucose/mannose-6-phosphate isomerase